MPAGCLACGGVTLPMIDLGRMPLADAFREPDDQRPEFFYHLTLERCPACGLLEQANPVRPEQMFHADYPYLTGTSRRMAQHFMAFGQEVAGWLDRADGSFIIELGGNDGTLLAPLAQRGFRVLNVEPSANVAALGEERGVPAMIRFFDLASAVEVAAKHGPADAIVAANTITHVERLADLFDGVRMLLARNGLFVFEEPYLGDILANNAVDQFYDEHVTYLSLAPVEALARRVALEVIDVARQPTHGGSMRYVLAHCGARAQAPSVDALRREERAAALREERVYENLRRSVARVRRELPELLGELAAAGRRVAGFGATAKSATILNYCRIGPQLLPYIVDNTPMKQGKLTPGMHIPVRAYEEFETAPPDYALLLAWNHEAEIRAANRWFDQHRRWITYIPKVRLL